MSCPWYFARSCGATAAWGGAGTLLYASALLFTSIGVGTVLGAVEAVTALISGVLVAPFGFAILAARKLARMGFAHADLAPAFRQELERSREERDVGRGRVGQALERVLAWATRACGSYAVVAIPAILVGLVLPGARSRALAALPATLAALTTGVGAGIAYLVSLQQRRDIDTEAWSALWSGRIGTLAFACARRLSGRAPVAAPMTHRATELSLGMAAENLYESLPKETKRALGDLPEVLRRLQRDAQALRCRLEDLDPVVPRQASGIALHESLRAERDVVAARLFDVVGALETIRLNLLRLHADVSALPSVTTHFDVAQEVSREVARLLSARGDVEGALRFPRQLATTPA